MDLKIEKKIRNIVNNDTLLQSAVSINTALNAAGCFGVLPLRGSTLNVSKNACVGSLETKEIKLKTKLASALDIKEGNTSYMRFITSDSNQQIQVNQNFKIINGLLSGTTQGLAKQATKLLTDIPPVLKVNTVYKQLSSTDNIFLTLPGSALAGDTITIIIAGSLTHTLQIGRDSTFYKLGSYITVIGAPGGRNGKIEEANGTNHGWLKIIGDANGDGGIGSKIELSYDGDLWSVFGTVYPQGNGSNASNSIFIVA